MSVIRYHFVSLHQGTLQNSLISPPGQTVLIWYVVSFFFLEVKNCRSDNSCSCFSPHIVGLRDLLFFFLSSSLQPANATWATLTKKQCLKYGGELVGETCGYVPDITLMSFILFFGTYACSMALKQFKTSRFFPTTVSDGTPSINAQQF